MLRILQVNTADLRGGAETVARNLHRAYRYKGHESWMAVGHKYTDDPNILAIQQTGATGDQVRRSGRVGETLSSLGGKAKGMKRFVDGLRIVGQPRHFFPWWQGSEDFNFPGTEHLLELPTERPDVVHCHNLHGRYFDLRVLPRLSHDVPVILTLHDAWLLSGHCAHSFDCDRWKTGCGHCPDLTIYPAVRRDATNANWQRKLEIWKKSRLHVATPSRWLMRKVEQSILAAGILDTRIIPNGVDLSVFHPGDKDEARAALGIPHDARMLLFAANGIRANIWKDYVTMRSSVRLLAARSHGDKIVFTALGEYAPPERIGDAEVRFVPYEESPNAVARYYQAADVYVHAARADNFPLTVLEALACGIPVVATGVGGIPEQVVDGSSGFVVPPSDAEAMERAIDALLSDEGLRRRFSAWAVQDAANRFDLNRQADEYLEWYGTILGRAQETLETDRTPSSRAESMVAGHPNER